MSTAARDNLSERPNMIAGGACVLKRFLAWESILEILKKGL